MLMHPLSYLNSRPSKDGKTLYEHSPTPFTKSKKETRDIMLSSGEIAAAIVISHDCEIDKESKPSRPILIAPAFPLDTLPPENQLAVSEQRRFSLMPLPNVPQLGNYYADFRLIQPLRRAFLVSECRLASMNTDAVDRLQAQLTAYLTRRLFSASAPTGQQ